MHMSFVSSATRSGNPEMDLGLETVADLALTHARRHTTHQETQSESSKCFLPMLYYFSCLFYFVPPPFLLSLSCGKQVRASYQTALVLAMELSSH